MFCVRIRRVWRTWSRTTLPRCSRHGLMATKTRWTSLLYPEFRRIARQYLVRRTGDSLESAALANEVYLKLTSAGRIRCEDRTHFLALCAQMIRHTLVDHARRRRSTKRGGDALRVPLDEVLLEVETG